MRHSTLRAALVVAPFAALVLGGCSSDSPAAPVSTSPQAGTVEAAANANTFSPQTMTIAPGGTVTWTFGARPHNVTFTQATGVPTNVPTTTNGQVSRTFATAGTYAYACTIHAGMTGTVVVQ